EKKKFRLPRTDEHVAILGCTGSGKTTLASWILSRAPFDKMPYVCIDYKNDDLLASIERLEEISLNSRIPDHPGLYVVRPQPSDVDDVEQWLWKVWSKGGTGLYVDEAYLLPDKKAITNILAQGRSLRIPCIFASQRPVIVPRSVFTEASHIAVFRLNDRRDKKTVAEFTPDGMMTDGDGREKRLPDFHSFWYNVKDHADFILSPVPQADKIVETINDRLAPEYKVT
ncbi:MAG: ATP-binding protein, partial [Patescibacteria group bacterium]|nr:ATP-binding protein [Patescibacteria group bacterium]